MVILSNRMGCKNHSLMCQRLDMANLGAREVRIWMLVVKKNQVKSSMGNGKIRGQQGQLSIPKNAALWRTKGILGHSNPAQTCVQITYSLASSTSLGIENLLQKVAVVLRAMVVMFEDVRHIDLPVVLGERSSLTSIFLQSSWLRPNMVKIRVD